MEYSFELDIDFQKWNYLNLAASDLSDIKI